MLGRQPLLDNLNPGSLMPGWSGVQYAIASQELGIAELGFFRHSGQDMDVI